MGAAYFIVLERQIDGVDTRMDGKSISREMEALDDAARQLGVRPLSEFFSADPEQLAEFLDGENAIELPPLQQFTAQEGLATVRALLAHPTARTDGVTEDLRQYERILNAAAEHGIGWHFEIDI